ncbi:MAG: twin-arginine translocase TatA/TatE family subunit [Candidatus Dormibacteria bacterium]
MALIVFGPKRLPELGHGLGKAITEFKKGASELTGSHDHTTTSEVVEPVPALAGAHPESASTAVPAAETSLKA